MLDGPWINLGPCQKGQQENPKKIMMKRMVEIQEAKEQN